MSLALSTADKQRFPMLIDQVRCSSGYTEVKGGVIRAFGTQEVAKASPILLDEPGETDLARRVMRLLRALAADGRFMPPPWQLARLIGLDCTAAEVLAALTSLVERKRISMVSGRSDWGPFWWAIRILDVRAVLRTMNCPPEVQP